MISLKKNIFFSTVLTVSNYIFPLLVFPYVSRVLGVHNIGVCNFIDSTINYYILFSMMGMNIIGIREIASARNDRRRLDETFSGLFYLNTISTTVILIILISSIYYVPKFYQYKELMYIGALKLMFNYLLIEWLYKGLEEFKYITIRSIIVKAIYVIAVFIFVREENDYPVYFSLMVGTVIVNAIINIWHSRKYTSLLIEKLKLKSFIRPFFILGLYSLLTSMYTSFNVIFLGFVAGETEVGFYTTATKLYSIILALFTAFSGVMLPRMSSLVKDGKLDEFKNLANKSIDGLLAFSMPLLVISVVFAPQIINVIAGEGYSGAILSMRIIMPLLFIIGYEQILVVHMLMPLKSDKIIFRNSIVGAVIGIILNILLVPLLKSIGSAIVWVSCEVVILILSQYAVNRKMEVFFPFKKLLLNILYAIPPFLLCCFLLKAIPSPIILLGLGGSFTVIYFFIVQYYFIKNELVVSVLAKFVKRIYNS